jgi:para-nitrobenzyl esterase
MDAEQDGKRFFDFLGVSSLEEARRLDAVFIRDKTLEYNHFWGSVIDGHFSVGNAYTRFLTNQRCMVPVLFGRTSTEFFNVPMVNTLEEFRNMAVEMFGENAGEYLELCQANSGTFEEVVKRASVSSIEYAIRIMAQANFDTGANIPLYYYNFDAEIPGWDNPGTFHSVDLWFFFETLAKCWRPFVGKHYDLARQMCNYWANFIRNGDPNGKDSTGEQMPHWDEYTADAPYGMVFADKAEFVREQPSDLMDFLVREYFRKAASET